MARPISRRRVDQRPKRGRIAPWRATRLTQLTVPRGFAPCVAFVVLPRENRAPGGVAFVALGNPFGEKCRLRKTRLQQVLPPSKKCGIRRSLSDPRF